MLRLWTERFFAGVFPDAGWLRKSGGNEIGSYVLDPHSQLSVLDGLDMLLQDKALSARTEIELVISDSHARILYLPWQDKLNSEAQREVYARGCLEQAGLVVDEEWLVHAAYRKYQGGGVAYGLPRSLVASVEAHLAVRRLRLCSIMPLSAYAYWHGKGIAARGRSVILLEEQRRATALLFGDQKCIGMQVQPGNKGPDATKRLLRAIDAVFPEVGQMQIWSIRDESSYIDSLRQILPRATIEQIDKGFWP